MVVLSARFAILACLCAALPLAVPPSVEAAHLYGSQSMKNHASSHSGHRTRNAYPTPTYDGKHHEHKAPDRRSPELPPLLRRHSVHNHMMAGGHQGKVPHDHPHRARSAFARSRYRREPEAQSRRTSVYVPGEHGSTYLVSWTPPRSWGNARASADKQSTHTYNRRQVDETNLVLGRVDIMGAQPAGGTQRLASLTVESTPIDWTSGQSSLKAFPLNASTANQTQFIMMPMDELTNTADTESFNKHVTLATEVFDAGSAEMVMYCATYDPDPGSSSALLMTPCTGETQSAPPANDATDPCSDVTSDASSPNPHQSQIFSYDPSSGKIEPISAATTSSGVGNSAYDLTRCAGAKVRRADGNTTSVSTQPSSTSSSTAPVTSASQQAQNVTLVYVAGALEVPASSPGASNTNTTSVSIGQTAVFTTTITTTVVATVAATGPSNRTATPARAAVSVSTPSAPSQSTVTASRSSLFLSPPGSVPATATSKGPASAEESLEVEIVGVTPSTTSSSSLASSATTTSTLPSSSSSTGPSPNAEAVASSIANGAVPPRRRAFVSAAGNVSPPRSAV